jgi:hypothetical protein
MQLATCAVAYLVALWMTSRYCRKLEQQYQTETASKSLRGTQINQTEMPFVPHEIAPSEGYTSKVSASRP